MFPSRDFKSLASANFATSALFGGATQIRTGDKGFADPCLTAWLWRRTTGKKPVIKKWSGKRDSNSRHLPWQGNALPLSHSRVVGGNNRARTYDPLLVRQMLSQLSYAPVLAIADIIYQILTEKASVFKGFFKIFQKNFRYSLLYAF